MEKLKFSYSLKNIPTPEKKLPTMLLREDRHLFHKNAYKSMRIFFINNNITANENGKKSFIYRLRSGRSPLQVKGLIQFEDDLVRIVK